MEDKPVKTQIKEHNIDWQGISILITHAHKAWGVIEHLEIKTIDPPKAPLPITDTGYLSHYLDESYLQEYGGAVAYILAWLDHESKKSAWKSKQETARQYSLF